MSELRDHFQTAKQSHLAARYPGDLAAEVLASKRRMRPIWLLAPLAAAAVVAVVTWNLAPSTLAPHRIEPTQQVVATNDSLNDGESLFAIGDVPTLQDDMGISPLTEESSMPSFSEVTMPEMPSFDPPDATTPETST